MSLDLFPSFVLVSVILLLEVLVRLSVLVLVCAFSIVFFFLAMVPVALFDSIFVAFLVCFVIVPMFLVYT